MNTYCCFTNGATFISLHLTELDFSGICADSSLAFSTHRKETHTHD